MTLHLIHLNFLIYDKNFIFFFISVWRTRSVIQFPHAASLGVHQEGSISGQDGLPTDQNIVYVCANFSDHNLLTFLGSIRIQNMRIFSQSIRMPCDRQIIIIKNLISIYIYLPISRKVSTGFGSKYTYDAYLFQCYKVLFCLFEGPQVFV